MASGDALVRQTREPAFPLSGGTVSASVVRASICPYRGLEPFREEDAPFYCGRDEAIREVVAPAPPHDE
jgi:hypothetical protein